MADEWVTGRVVLKVNGVPLDLEMTVPAVPVKPHRMLPIFHQMANSFADIGVQAVEYEGKSISCKAGCGACCRQPVPISEIEAYQIAELVEAMPEPRRTDTKETFAKAYSHFEKLNWFDEFRRHYLKTKTTTQQMDEAMKVLRAYFEEGIACPFLVDESCSIHLERPVSCREYLVTSSPVNCANLDGKNIEMVPLPIKPTKSLQKLARTDVGRASGQLVLIQALKYADENTEKFDEKTGEAWMAEFFKGLPDDPVPQPPDSGVGHRKKKRHAKC